MSLVRKTARSSRLTGPHPVAAVQTARFIRERCPLEPAAAVVLGSSFGPVADLLESAVWFPWSDLPGFPATRVEGHSGQLGLGCVEDIPVLFQAGRPHFYEGHSLADVTFPIRVIAALGAPLLLLTNAAGGIHPRLQPGDFMIIRDHLNCLGADPLRAITPTPFVDLTHAYDPALRKHLRAALRTAGTRVRSGVYLAVPGPSYETPAEIRAFARWGADAVGMSTVAETIVARQCGLRVAGLSGITNLAAGRSASPIRHAEVLALGRQTATMARRIVADFLRRAAGSAAGNAWH